MYHMMNTPHYCIRANRCSRPRSVKNIKSKKSSAAQVESNPQINVNVSVNIENIENKTEKDIDEFIEYILQKN